MLSVYLQAVRDKPALDQYNVGYDIAKYAKLCQNHSESGSRSCTRHVPEVFPGQAGKERAVPAGKGQVETDHAYESGLIRKYISCITGTVLPSDNGHISCFMRPISGRPLPLYLTALPTYFHGNKVSKLNKVVTRAGTLIPCCSQQFYFQTHCYLIMSAKFNKSADCVACRRLGWKSP